MQDLIAGIATEKYQEPTAEKFEVMFVEDSIDSQELVTTALQSFCKVTSVATASEAVTIAEKKKFDLFLIDIMLGDGDGFSVVRMLKQKKNCKETPVIFLTSHGTIENKV